jgi:hypothetical protein
VLRGTNKEHCRAKSFLSLVVLGIRQAVIVQLCRERRPWSVTSRAREATALDMRGIETIGGAVCYAPAGLAPGAPCFAAGCDKSPSPIVRQPVNSSAS